MAFQLEQVRDEVISNLEVGQNHQVQKATQSTILRGFKKMRMVW